MFTVFTPTYNRAYIINKLYKSLIEQSLYNFEWVIVDDGSTDETEGLITKFIEEKRISIKYYKQPNGGKHRAINKGVELAKGELFFIVDSDDYLTADAIKTINEQYSFIRNKEEFAGISFRRGYSESEYIGTQVTFKNIEASALDFRFKYKIKGDMAEVYKLNVLKKFPFPDIPGEKFCSEGLIWNRIALKYKILWISKIIYIGEYLEGGLTNNSFLLRKMSPKYATQYYSELSKMPISLQQKIRATINYWRFAKFLDVSFVEKWCKVNPLLSTIALPLSVIFLLKK